MRREKRRLEESEDIEARVMNSEVSWFFHKFLHVFLPCNGHFIQQYIQQEKYSTEDLSSHKGSCCSHLVDGQGETKRIAFLFPEDPLKTGRGRFLQDSNADNRYKIPIRYNPVIIAHYFRLMALKSKLNFTCLRAMII